MSTDGEKSRLTVAELATRFRSEMIPLTGKFSYFSLLPIAEEDLRQYLNDPIAAISPAIVTGLPRMGVILAPYVEKGNGKGVDCATFERPAEARHIPSARSEQGGMLVLVLGVKDIEVADYHYQFYNALAGVVAERWPQDVQERFFRTIREELSAEVHGEVDEKSWHLKQALLRRQTNVRKETKLFREYARQAFEDTLTLYLHGTCCDIDVETGSAPDAQPVPAAQAGTADLDLSSAGRVCGAAGAVEVTVGAGRRKRLPHLSRSAPPGFGRPLVCRVRRFRRWGRRRRGSRLRRRRRPAVRRSAAAVPGARR